MRGASEEDQHRVLGGSLTYERRLPDALFLGSKKLPLSNDIVKDEAIVDARWVRLCTSGSFICKWVG